MRIPKFKNIQNIKDFHFSDKFNFIIHMNVDEFTFESKFQHVVYIQISKRKSGLDEFRKNGNC